MPRNIDAATIAALDDENLAIAILCEVIFDAVTLRFCTHMSEIAHGGNTYYGAGAVGSISSTEENVSLDPTSCTIEISATDPATVAAFANNEHLNRKIKVMLALLDQSGAVIGEPIDHFTGSMDEVRVSIGGAPTIAITASNEMSDWDREEVSRWTHEGQQEKYPGDMGFEFVTETAAKVFKFYTRG